MKGYMLTPWEIKKKNYMPPLFMVKLNIAGAFSLVNVLLKNIGMIKNMKNQSLTFNYQRPEKTYDIPSYKSSMRYCKEDTKYLRPTLFCNSHAPEVVALAHELGAYKKTDYEFAEAAFEFVKRKITLEIIELDDVDKVIRRGTGTCLHEISLFLALCRAAGIKSRYKLYALTMLDEWMKPAENAPIMKEWYDAMGFFLMHGEGEVLIDGKWIPADVGPTPERQASAGLPLTKFGEDSIDIWLFPIPGTIITRESIPLGYGFASDFLINKLASNSITGLNVGILKQIEQGKKIILNEGGEAKYDIKARKREKPKRPTIKLDKKIEKIIFED